MNANIATDDRSRVATGREKKKNRNKSISEMPVAYLRNERTNERERKLIKKDKDLLS